MNESIALFFKEGSSNKAYQAQLTEVTGGLWVVNFQYGRRGQSLTSGTKTSSPVPYDQAKKIYDKVVKEKTQKGYTAAEGAVPYQDSPKGDRISGLLPQLLNFITEEQAYMLCSDDDWIAEEKKDGVRQMLQINTIGVNFINRKGLIVAGSEEIAKDTSIFDTSCVLDGETIGDTYWAFDLLEIGKTDLRGKGALDRLTALLGALYTYEGFTAINPIPYAVTTSEKLELFEKLRREKAEGIVFKRKDAKYTPGRPNSGGTALKFKFTGRATCQVDAQNGEKRSVFVSVLDGDELVRVGKCTILPNFPIPRVGELVEVEYLNIMRAGSLYQPVYLGPSADKDVPDQYITLKFKQGSDEEDEA